MSQQNINIGAVPNDGTGDALRVAFQKCNDNFSELYSYGTGTVNSVSVVAANGISGTVASPATNPAITLSLGAITPSSVNGVTFFGASSPQLTVTGTSGISGNNTGDQTITLTGDVTGTGTGSFAATISNNAVTYGKFQKVAGLSVVGNGGSTTADSSAITGTPGQVLRVDNGGTALAFGALDLSTAGSVTGTLSIGSGGTGLSSVGLNNTVLISNGISASWTQVSLTAGVTGTLPVANGGTGITSLGTGVATWLETPSSANLAAAITDETGSGSLVFGTSPTISGATLTGQTVYAAGTAAAPSVSFAGSLGTGMYSAAANYLAFATSGTFRLGINSGGQTLLAGAGSAANPSLVNNSYNTTGIWWPTTSTLAISTGGAEALRVDSSQRLLVGGSANVGIPDGAGASFIPKFISQAASGNAAVAAYVNDGTNNRRIGLFVDQTNALCGISTSTGSTSVPFVYRDVTAERLRITTNGEVQIAAAGTAAAPALTLGGDTDTGIYRSGSKQLSIVTNASIRLSVDSSGNVRMGTTSIATTATDGFLYVAGCAGTPTGTPTAYTGRVPIVVDTTNNKLYFYSGGAWRDAGP